MGDEAEAQLAHYSGGHHVPDYGDDQAHAADLAATYVPGDDPEADAELEEFDAAMGAAEIAEQLGSVIGVVMERNNHTCSLSEYAATTLHEGGTVVLCGCGEFFEAPELAPPAVDLSPERVSAHSPQAVMVAAADPIARTLALIGPDQDYRPDEVERLMLDTVRRLEEGQPFERWALEQASAARSAFDRQFALEFTKASGPMELRRYTAENACAELAAERDRTDMIHRAAKAAMHNLRSTLSGYQSVLRSVQATYQAGGSSGGRPY